jgi:hypothetical protein
MSRTSLCVVALFAGCGGLRAQDGATADDPTEGADPGTVVLHRLNRTEYDLTVRDLLGTTQTPAADTFPPDDAVGGWDNIASNLTLSPLHLEMMELAAGSLATEALALPLDEPLSYRAEGEGPDVTTTTGGAAGEAWSLWSNGDLSASFDAPASGTYVLSTRVWANQAGPDLARMTFGHDGFVDLTIDVAAEGTNDAEVHEVEVFLGTGHHTFTVSFLNDFYDEAAGLDRNLYVDWLDAFGPIDAPAGPNPIRDSLVTCDPTIAGDDACATEVLGAFARRAWRRPLADDELDRLVAVATGVLDSGGTFDDALFHGLVTVLTNPHFLYRVEIDPDPSDPTPHPLSDHEVATRLSYLVWSSLPDATLAAAADDGLVHTREQVTAQVVRMLADPKAAALVDHFGGQWLFFRGIPDVTKDPNLFPGFDETLKASMAEEMRRFFESFVFERRDLRELLTATEGEIDETLAAHYGATDYVGPGWQPVDLAALDRGGVLGQAGMLAIESYPTRTSPVIRGKYVLGQLLCDEPPPPPPGVEGLDETGTADTIREQLELHRADPVCASCHVVMDEIGFGLEHFDAVGAWRDTDGGAPVDATGQFPDGTTFEGARELADLLSADPRLTRCMAESLFTYGLGRLAVASDEPWLDAIETAFVADGATFESLAIAVATSDAFLTRRGGE